MTDEQKCAHWMCCISGLHISCKGDNIRRADHRSQHLLHSACG